MDRLFRVGMLISRFYPCQGGAELQCLRLSKELARKNNTISIFTQRLPGLSSAETHEGLPIRRFGLPIDSRIGSFSYILDGFLQLRRDIGNFDIFHAHLASAPAVLAGFIRKFFNKPVILKFGGSRKTGDIHTSLSTPHGKLKLGFLRGNIDRFVCPSSELKQELASQGFPEDRINVIPNGVDTAVFRPVSKDARSALRTSLSLPLDRKIAMFSGRLEPGKGLEVMLDAWRKLAGGPQKPLLLVAGSGSLEKQLSSASKEDSSVVFLGWKTNISDYIKASDVFIFPSFGEGMPNALLEAMACGLPCLSTRIGGVVELIEDGKSGLLTEPGDFNAVAGAVNRLFSDQALSARLGEAAAERIKRSLSIETVAGKYMDLYGELLNK